jgi:hypothetical protein
MKFRFDCTDATPVVPLPIKQSRMVSPSLECNSKYCLAKEALLASTSEYLLDDFMSCNQEDVLLARTRYEAWARNQGDSTPYGDKTYSRSNYSINIESQDLSSDSLLIVIISAAALVSVTLLTTVILKKKHK